MKAQKRITNPQKIDRDLIEQELKAGKLVIIQFSEKSYTDKMLADLNELCLFNDDNFNIRFFGHTQDAFDCKTLLKIPNIKALWLECFNAYNISELMELKYLKRLSLGVFELKETEILQADNFRNLTELIIGDTKTKALNLKYLDQCSNLAQLTICGHTKNIGAVGHLANLESLRLNSISNVPLDFINNLKRLKSLYFILGGRENLDKIEANEIENLEIVRVRGFSGFKNISNFKKLKSLQIEDQIRLNALHFDSEIPTLKDLKLINCKCFNSLTGLERLTNLQQLRIYKTDINFDELINQTLPESLEIFAFYTTKSKVDLQIKERLLRLGFNDGLNR